jgi:bacillithiol biosynthesis cysteine-adding enzyme BshC
MYIAEPAPPIRFNKKPETGNRKQYIFTPMFAAERIPYAETNSFTKIVTDYLNGEEKLQPFYSYSPTADGIRKAIESKSGQKIDRKILVEVLRDQYQPVNTHAAVSQNIEKLLSGNSFTVCTAHQPNLFTGPLYFIYKIMHAIRLAEQLNKENPRQEFVPVFYMGSEDADLDELDHFTVQGKTYRWQTGQKGAVGRMTVDKALVQIISELERQLAVENYGKAFTSMLKYAFQIGTTIQQATLKLVNHLFGEFGLVVLIADDARLKKQLLPVFEDDLFQHNPGRIVTAASEKLGAGYNVQAHPREINLFYLLDDVRERIELAHNKFSVNNSTLHFTKEEMAKELAEHPERFSPNVILRGLFQETILPNVAFIGGGGEVAYWLQLKPLFDHYNISFPVILLRNSFLIIEKKQQELLAKLQLPVKDLFLPAREILNRQLEAEGKRPALNGEVDQLKSIFSQLKQLATSVDSTLEKHVESLKTQTTNHLAELEKKMLRAERKKHEAMERQIEKLKRQLFPGNGFQERTENISYYYAKFGKEILQELLAHSLATEQQFTILTES